MEGWGDTAKINRENGSRGYTKRKEARRRTMIQAETGWRQHREQNQRLEKIVIQRQWWQCDSTKTKANKYKNLGPGRGAQRQQKGQQQRRYKNGRSERAEHDYNRANTSHNQIEYDGNLRGGSSSGESKAKQEKDNDEKVDE